MNIFALANRSILLTGVLLATLGIGNAHAVSIFSDNFDTENGSAGAINFNAFSQWTVSDGSVDLIGAGFFDLIPGNGLYIDMDGTTRDGGKMTSMVIALAPGDYTLSYELAGNQRTIANEIVSVTLVGFVNTAHALATNVPFTLFQQNFSVLAATNATIIFEQDGGDNFGMLLDDINLEFTPTQRVPEPLTALLLCFGLFGSRVLNKMK